MAEELVLHGYRYSVYARMAQVALHLAGASYSWREADPFSGLPEGFAALHPFGRVPVLCHGSFSLYETGAITRYLDRLPGTRPLQPQAPQALARMDQVIAVVDSYAYVPMVRQVFSHRVFRPSAGEPHDEEAVKEGTAASRRVLAALERIAAEGMVLDGRRLTLADCHLAPVMDYFLCTPEGRAALAGYPKLSAWWQEVSGNAALKETQPDLSALAAGTAGAG